MRGEHVLQLRRELVDAGSSPHARGARRLLQRRASSRGLIPACAGSTGWQLTRNRIPPAHPRMRGEHDRSHRTNSAAVGSSPHARGARCALPATQSSLTAHPRMRGEHQVSPSRSRHRYGSSPHARGALYSVMPRPHRRRLIPACAGSTFEEPVYMGAPAAHPRMRGEHKPWKGSNRDRYGSSPHARGAPGVKAAREAMGMAHPRMRGEHNRAQLDVIGNTGSSPHARGARTRPRVVRARAGLIPACAGSTASNCTLTRGCTAHPRMRGEHPSICTDITGPPGSSPHARGAPRAGAGQRRAFRLIPACAGSTFHLKRPCRMARAHPRMRGEHTVTDLDRLHMYGSSPHARGAPAGAFAKSLGLRLIPACAGSTPQGPVPRHWPRAHPRMRGEHPDGTMNDSIGLGSSPHARGALVHC